MNTSEQAWCASEWLKGRTQIDIARSLGYHSSTDVCVAISLFTSTRGRHVYNSARKAVAQERLASYRGAIKRPSPPNPWPRETAYNEARREHAFLLRAEGAPYKEIAARLDVSTQRAFCMVAHANRRLQYACHRAQVVLT